MEAPEKIYLIRNISSNTALNTTNDSHDKYLHEWYKSREKDADVEYTRTDALIEKACNLLDRMIWEVTYEDLEGDSTQHYDKMEFIEDFRNYMKKNYETGR